LKDLPTTLSIALILIDGVGPVTQAFPDAEPDRYIPELLHIRQAHVKERIEGKA
jgi:hypothetical protein